MAYFNLESIQSKTCTALEKKDWMAKFIEQVKNAADNGETSILLKVADTPAKGGSDEWDQLIDYFTMRGFSVNITKECDLVISWSPNNHYNMKPVDRVELAIHGLTYVACLLVEALTTGDEEKKKVLYEEADVIANGLPDGFIPDSKE